VSQSQTVRIVFPYVGDSVGGAQISSLLLVRHLDTTRFEPVVVVHQKGPLTQYLNEIKQPFVYLPLPSFLGKKAGAIFRIYFLVRVIPILVRFLWRQGASLVHAQDGRMNTTWALSVKLTRCKFVWHQRSKYAPSRLADLAMLCADRIVTISKFSNDALPPKFSKHAVVVTNPFDAGAELPDRQLAQARLKDELSIGHDARVVAFVANFMERKRPEMFLDMAVCMLQEKKFPLMFVLFGSDREGLKGQLERHVERNGLKSAVRFAGFRNHMENWISGCDVLVAPALNEPFGRTLVEAMLVGTPVVASSTGGHREIIENRRTGLYPDTDDAEGFAQATLSLLEDPEWADGVAAEAQKQSRKRYSIPFHVEQICAVYSKLLSAN